MDRALRHVHATASAQRGRRCRICLPPRPRLIPITTTGAESRSRVVFGAVGTTRRRAFPGKLFDLYLYSEGTQAIPCGVSPSGLLPVRAPSIVTHHLRRLAHPAPTAAGLRRARFESGFRYRLSVVYVVTEMNRTRGQSPVPAASRLPGHPPDLDTDAPVISTARRSAAPRTSNRRTHIVAPNYTPMHCPPPTCHHRHPVSNPYRHKGHHICQLGHPSYKVRRPCHTITNHAIRKR